MCFFVIELSVLVGLLVSRIEWLLMNECVMVMCCCLFLERFLGK